MDNRKLMEQLRKTVREVIKEELDEMNPQKYRDTAFIRSKQAQLIGGSSADLPGVANMIKKTKDLDAHATDIENKRRAIVLSKDGRVRGNASGATLRKFGIKGEAVEKMEKTDETTNKTVTIPVASFPMYKKGEQPTIINPETGEEEIESDVSSWATDENRYSLKEFIGMMQEAGYKLNKK